MMEFLTSNKGKRQITLNGYIYNKQKLLANNTISWECTERRNARLCMARIKTVDDQVVGRLNQHTSTATRSITRRKGKSEHERPSDNNYGKNTRHNKWSCRGTK